MHDTLSPPILHDLSQDSVGSQEKESSTMHSDAFFSCFSIKEMCCQNSVSKKNCLGEVCSYPRVLYGSVSLVCAEGPLVFSL